MRKKVLILGATSYVAKGLIHNFSKNSNYDLILLARNANRILKFIEKNNLFWGLNYFINNIDNLHLYDYDVIINCINIRELPKDNEYELFQVTEKYDNLIINYLKRNPKVLYINFSSGAVYGKNYSAVINETSKSVIDMNNIEKKDFYYINKIYTEMKHRSLKKLNIVDIRLFNYFSRFFDNLIYFIDHLAQSVIKKKLLVTTSNNNIIRDYIDPEDLFQLIECCINKNNLNDSFDTYSLEPIDKKSLISFFVNNYDLKYKLKNKISFSASTGHKNAYYSKNYKAKKIGYKPKYTSLESIEKELLWKL